MKKDLDSFDLGIDNDHVTIDDLLEAGRALTRISNTYKISLRMVFKTKFCFLCAIFFYKNREKRIEIWRSFKLSGKCWIYEHDSVIQRKWILSRMFTMDLWTFIEQSKSGFLLLCYRDRNLMAHPFIEHVLLSTFWNNTRLRIQNSQSEASSANRFAFDCFKKADVDIKLDNSNTMDDWNRLKWSFAKPRFYNGSPLIEVNHALNYRLLDRLNFRDERSRIWMTFVLVKFQWCIVTAFGIQMTSRIWLLDPWKLKSWVFRHKLFVSMKFILMERLKN